MLIGWNSHDKQIMRIQHIMFQEMHHVPFEAEHGARRKLPEARAL